MAMSQMAIMDFVQRFHVLQAHRDSGNELIKVFFLLSMDFNLARLTHKLQDLLVYCEGVETGLRNENTRLAKELEDAQLDLEDARRSRREMQQQLNLASARMGQFNADCESMRVWLVLP